MSAILSSFAFGSLSFGTEDSHPYLFKKMKVTDSSSSNPFDSFECYIFQNHYYTLKKKSGKSDSFSGKKYQLNADLKEKINQAAQGTIVEESAPVSPFKTQYGASQKVDGIRVKHVDLGSFLNSNKKSTNTSPVADELIKLIDSVCGE